MAPDLRCMWPGVVAIMGNSTSLLKTLLANASRMNFSSLWTFSGVGGNGRLAGRDGGGLGVDDGGESGGNMASSCEGVVAVFSDIAAAVAHVVSPVGGEFGGNS